MENNRTTEGSIRVARNTIVLVGLRVLMPALAVALVLLISRYLGATGLGRYTLAFTFLYMFNAVAPLGLNAIITRDGARDRLQLPRLLGNSLVLGSITSVILGAVMAGLPYLFGYDEATKTAILILSLAVLPCTIGMFQDGAFIALERMDCLALGTVAEYVLKVGVSIVLLLMGYGLEVVLIVAVLGRVLGCVISAYLLKRLSVAIRWTLDRAMVKDLLKQAPTFLLIGIFATLYWRIDIFMLSMLRPVEDVGYYGAAWRMLELAMVIPQSLCLSLYPRISAAAATKDPGRLTGIGRGAMRYLLAFSLPAAIGVTLLAEPLLTLFYGQTFVLAASTLSVLIFTLVPYCIVRYHAYVLVGENHQRIDLTLNVIMSATNIVLNLILIPRYSYLGAAIATLVSICAYGLLQYCYLIRKLPGRAAQLSIPTPVLAGCALTALSVLVLRDYNMFVAIAAGAVTYGVCLLVGGFFSETELKLLGINRFRHLLGRS